MSLIEIKNINYKVEDKQILSNIYLNIEKGDFISLVGPSGSGKSTFLKILADLISPSDGEIIYNKKKYSDYNPLDLRKEIAYIRQSPYLFENTVKENIEFPYLIRKKSMDMDRVKKLFSDFKMPLSYLDRDVENLSGGEKQRLSIIRSLIFEPKVLLLDEITSSLDVKNVGIVEEVIKNLNDEEKTIVWVTHSPEQSKKYANKICKLVAGEIDSVEVLR